MRILFASLGAVALLAAGVGATIASASLTVTQRDAGAQPAGNAQADEADPFLGLWVFADNPMAGLAIEKVTDHEYRMCDMNGVTGELHAWPYWQGYATMPEDEAEQWAADASRPHPDIHRWVPYSLNDGVLERTRTGGEREGDLWEWSVRVEVAPGDDTIRIRCYKTTYFEVVRYANEAMPWIGLEARPRIIRVLDRPATEQLPCLPDDFRSTPESRRDARLSGEALQLALTEEYVRSTPELQHRAHELWEECVAEAKEQYHAPLEMYW